MEQILSNYTASISELKKSPAKVMAQAKGESVAILNHKKISGYLVPVDVYHNLINAVDDYLLSKEVGDRLNDNIQPVMVSIDDL